MVHPFLVAIKRVFIPMGIQKDIIKAHQRVIVAHLPKLSILKMSSEYLQIVNSYKNLNTNKLFK